MAAVMMKRKQRGVAGRRGGGEGGSKNKVAVN